jgi:hypothetical protein
LFAYYVPYISSSFNEHVINVLDKISSMFKFSGKGEIAASPGSILHTSSTLEKNAKNGLHMSHTSLSGEISENLHFGGQAGIVDVLKDSKESLNHHPRSWSDVHRQPASSSYGLIGNKVFTNAGSRESSLFSSSLSDMFSQKRKNLFHTC